MIINELRLGNYVQHEPYKDEIRKVDIALFGYIYNQNVHVVGVPLTTEILEKAGFNLYFSNPRLEEFYVNVQSYYPIHLYITRDDRIYYNENVQLRYLHQLQNLYFALTNKELTLEDLNKVAYLPNCQ